MGKGANLFSCFGGRRRKNSEKILGKVPSPIDNGKQDLITRPSAGICAPQSSPLSKVDSTHGNGNTDSGKEHPHEHGLEHNIGTMPCSISTENNSSMPISEYSQDSGLGIEQFPEDGIMQPDVDLSQDKENTQPSREQICQHEKEHHVGVFSTVAKEGVDDDVPLHSASQTFHSPAESTDSARPSGFENEYWLSHTPLKTSQSSLNAVSPLEVVCSSFSSYSQPIGSPNGSDSMTETSSLNLEQFLVTVGSSIPLNREQYAVCEENCFEKKDLELCEAFGTETPSSNGNGGPVNVTDKICGLEANSSAHLEAPSDLHDVLKEIDKLCIANNIQNAIITHDARDYKHMVLNGDGVTKLRPDLEKLQMEYGYKIETNEFKGYDYYDQFSQSPRHIWLKNASKDIGTVGLCLSGKDVVSGEIKQYAVTAAHCVLTEETQKSARDGDPAGLRAAQETLREEILSGDWTMKPYNDAPFHPVNGFPQYRMRSFAGRGNWHDKFSFDIALLELDESIACIGESSNVEGILEIGAKPQLDLLIKRWVKVFIGDGDIEGWIVPSDVPVGDRSGYIQGVMVYIRTEIPLYPGQSGSAIKVKYRDTNKFDVIGLLHGKSRLVRPDHREVYTGILLFPNLQQIEVEYPIKQFEISRCTTQSTSSSTERKISRLMTSTSLGYHSECSDI